MGSIVLCGIELSSLAPIEVKNSFNLFDICSGSEQDTLSTVMFSIRVDGLLFLPVTSLSIFQSFPLSFLFFSIKS